MESGKEFSGEKRFVDKKRKPDFDEKYIQKLNQQYDRILAGFSEKNRPEKEQLIKGTFQNLSERLREQEGFIYGEPQKALLQLKLARHFQHNKTIDSNTLFDAVIESPRFLNDDKGSLHRLFEVHEQKTIQKIAEIRKKRVEITGETINPYEALFTTKSGDYYLAHLLNMSHLEKESEYMNNCVGTSNSYINRMKRGEAEFFLYGNWKTIHL